MSAALQCIARLAQAGSSPSAARSPHAARDKKMQTGEKMVKFLSSRSKQRRGLCFTHSVTAFPCVLVQGATTIHSCGQETKSLVQVFVAMNMSARPSIQNIWNDPEYKYLSVRGLAAGHKLFTGQVSSLLTSLRVTEVCVSLLQSPAVAPLMPATAALALMHPSCSCSNQVWPRYGGSRGRVTCP